jgi:UDP:flavonoid glycosyltransferase YjiC (YdhE family)
VRAIVHHGGAGTTAAAVRAGAPQVVVPFHGDQPFWADLTWRLGVGTAPIARRKLNARRLAAAIETALGDGELRRKAAELGAQVRQEDGVKKAVEVIAAHYPLG